MDVNYVNFVHRMYETSYMQRFQSNEILVKFHEIILKHPSSTCRRPRSRETTAVTK